MRVVTYGFGMRSPIWRVGAALAVLVAALAVGGCVEDDPDTTPSPDPTSTPLFESDEEALAAAEEAYARYQAVEDVVFAEGGAGSERIEKVAVRDALEAGLAGAANFQRDGFHSVGTTTFDSLELQQLVAAEGNEDVVVAYICLDFSGTDVLDKANISVVQPGQLRRQPFQVSFDWLQENSALVLSSRDPWSGVDRCSE